MLNVGSMKLYYENMKRAKQVYDARSYLKLVLNKGDMKEITCTYTCHET
jgi:hypothetical protein